MRPINTFLLALPALLFSFSSLSQCPAPLNISQSWEIPFSFPKQALTSIRHQGGAPYLYVAAKERGLLAFDISGAAPSLADSVDIAALGNMDAISLHQDGQYIYLALGNIFSNTAQAGIAIVDISSPGQLTVKDVWIHGNQSGGGAIVKTSGDYAYLGAMREGLIILNIADKNNITFLSQLVPSISYPNPTNPDPLKYNARGMEIMNDKVYLCYDAGGLRIIDVADKQNPVETGKYSNPALYSRPRAYNNVVLDGPLAFVTIDYCGLEILNIADPANITPVSWWNPWQCDVPAVNNWFNSPGHTNEIMYSKGCRLLFMSTGKSEMQVVNVSDPVNPVLCDSFGNTTNSQGTWGIGLYKGDIYLNYIFVPFGIPFFSNWGGVKKLSWNNQCELAVHEVAAGAEINIYPNPAAEQLHIRSANALPAGATIAITNALGVVVKQHVLPVETNSASINIHNLPNGIYSCTVYTKVTRQATKVAIIR